MEVILLERIEKLGQMGDVVTVKPGFARNYLLPQKIQQFSHAIVFLCVTIAFISVFFIRIQTLVDEKL